MFWMRSTSFRRQFALWRPPTTIFLLKIRWNNNSALALDSQFTCHSPVQPQINNFYVNLGCNFTIYVHCSDQFQCWCGPALLRWPANVMFAQGQHQILSCCQAQGYRLKGCSHTSWLQEECGAGRGGGELLLSLCHQPAARRLSVVILKARNVPVMDITGFSGED